MRHYLHLVTLAMIVLTLNGFAQRISNEGVVSPETRIDPEAILPEMNVDPGEVFIVPVQVNNMENLENLRFRVTYDETILTNLAAYATGGVLDNGNYRIQIVYYDPNVIQFTFTSLNANLFTGSGEVGYIRFQAGEFGTSPLNFEMFTVNGVSYMSNTTNGQVIITNCLNATANAGENTTVCENQTYELTEATASNYESLLWTTNGDGTFDDPTILHPVYTPGEEDINTGYVFVCLEAFATPPCSNDFSCMKITLEPLPDIFAGEDDTICADNSGYQLNGSVENAVQYFWYTPNGSGEFDDFNLLNPVYTPSDQDYLLGQVTLCLSAIPTSPCTGVYEDCMNLSFYTLPDVTCPDMMETCENAEAFELTGGMPEGGEYTGQGVSNGMFDPSVVGVGVWDITYTYADANGCANSCTFQIEVTPLPMVNAGEDGSICEDLSGYQLAGEVENAENYFWYTLTGTGTFDDEFALDAVYTPSETDYLLGSVELCLQAMAIPPCVAEVSDCMTLTFVPLPEVTCPEDMTVCEDAEAFELTGATPDGGEYSGPGVEEGMFDPQVAGIGNAEITYSYTDATGCSNSCIFNIFVEQLPEVVCPEFINTCLNSEPFELTGATPEGGEYSGEGVENGIFDPAVTGLGTFEITYVYSDEFGCGGSCAFNVIVNEPPEVTCPDDFTTCIDAEPIYLNMAQPMGGIYSGDGVSDNFFDPGVAGLGDHTITYTYFDSEIGCMNTCQFVITVNEGPEVTCPENMSVCQDAEPFELTGGLPEGGEYSGNGVADNIFDPSVGTGSYEITYTYTSASGCSGSCTFLIDVTPVPVVNAGEDGVACKDFSGYQLNGQIENGEMMFWYTLMGTGEFDDPFSLDAVYTPSATDYLLGSVELCLKANALPPCTGEVSDCMTLTFLDAPEVTCPEDMVVCDNEEPFELTGGLPEGGEYSGDAVTDNMFYPDLAQQGANEVTYTYTNEQGCSGSCTFSIEVAPSPVVNAGGDTTICEMEVFENINATATNYSSVQWVTLNGGGAFDNENIVNATYVPSPSVDYSQGSIYLVLIASPVNPCVIGAQDQLTLSFQMLPDVNAGEDVTICSGETIVTEGTVDNSTGNYLWTTSGDGMFSDPTLLSNEYVPGSDDIASGNVVLSLSAEPISPCTTEITDDLMVTIISPPVAFAGDDEAVCADGEPFMMAGSVQNAGSIMWYTTNGTGSFDDPTILNAQYLPSDNDYLIGTVEICIQVSAIEPCAGDVSDCMNLTFNPLPEVTLEAYEPLCAGDDAFELYGGLPEGGTYFVDGEEATMFDPAVAGEYTLTYVYTNENGCTNSAEGLIVVNPLPEVICPADMVVCLDTQPFELEGATPEGGEYTGIGVEDGIFDPVVAGLGTVEITYTYTNENGCVDFCIFNITVNPPAQSFAGGDALIVAGDVFELTGSSAGNYTSLLWTGGDGTFDSPESLHPTYIPGEGDIAAGSVNLCLTAYAEDGCNDVTDCMKLSFNLWPRIEVSPISLKRMLYPGQNVTAALTISNPGYADLDYDMTIDYIDGSDWLSVTPVSGTIVSRTSGDIQVTFDATGLSDGIYKADLNIATNAPETPMVTVSITLAVGENSSQLVHLRAGWSGISSYQILDNPQLEDIFAEQIANGSFEIMLDTSGIFWPGQNVNQIGNWNTYKGYKVKMNLADSALFVGQFVDDQTVTLNPGISYMPVLSKTAVSAQEIFDQLDGNLLYAFDIYNGLVYWPDGGLFTLNTLEPGVGYLVMLTNSGEVVFPETDGLANYRRPVPQIISGAPWTVVNTGNAHIVSIYSSAFENLRIGDIVAVFNSDGQCAGMTRYQGGNNNLALVVYGDDVTTFAVDGMMAGEPMNFVVYSPSTMETKELQVSWDISMPNADTYANNGLSAVTSFKVGTTGIGHIIEASVQVYPNPAREKVMITINGAISKDAQLQVYDTRGSKLITRSINSPTTILPVNQLEEGMYLLRISNNGIIKIQKLIIRK